MLSQLIDLGIKHILCNKRTLESLWLFFPWIHPMYSVSVLTNNHECNYILSVFSPPSESLKPGMASGTPTHIVDLWRNEILCNILKLKC